MPRKKPAPATPAVLPEPDSDDWVEILPSSGMMRETARALLVAAETLGLDPARAVHSIFGGFRVPGSVLDAATLPTEPTPVAPQTAATPLAAIKAGASPGGADASA